MKKSFLVVFVIVFVVVAVVVTKIVYTKVYTALVGAPPSASTSAPAEDSLEYACVSNPEASNRGYVYAHGSGGLDPSVEHFLKELVDRDPKATDFYTFAHDGDSSTLAELGARFALEFDEFASQGFDEIVVLGESAGGVIASYAAHELESDGVIEIHTLASPLNGYKFGAAAERMAEGSRGFGREIVLGFEPFAEPSLNVSVYHHKTVEDEVLRSFCGSFASFCSPSVIQDNNVPGSEEFFYPDETHSSIVLAAGEKIVSCRL